MPGYGWLEKVFYYWREEEQKDIPEYWVNDDHMIDMYYLIEYMESHKSDPDALLKWLENHQRSINWEEFEVWADSVHDEPGYGWLQKMVATWEAAGSEVPDEWIGDDGMIEWDYVTEYLENQKGDTNPWEAKEWLEDHKHIIDWAEFDLWVESVKDKEGYEWL